MEYVLQIFKRGLTGLMDYVSFLLKVQKIVKA